MKANNYSTKLSDVQNINGNDTMVGINLDFLRSIFMQQLCKFLQNKEYAWLLKEEASKIFRRLENLLKVLSRDYLYV